MLFSITVKVWWDHMVKGKRRQSADKGSNAGDRHIRRIKHDEQWSERDPEDDPLRDLRPYDDDTRTPANEEYLWPEMNDEYEDDD